MSNAPTNVPMPAPALHAGQRLVTSAFSRSQVVDYGDARAAEATAARDATTQRSGEERGSLTEVEIEEEWNDLFVPDSMESAFRLGIRFAERAHGIDPSAASPGTGTTP